MSDQPTRQEMFQGIADEVPENEGDVDYVAICTECKSAQRDEYVLRNPFGLEAPCKFCGGGPLILIQASQTGDKLAERLDNRRGIDSQ